VLEPVGTQQGSNGPSRERATLELVAAVAIGLNPYIGLFVIASLTAFTGHVPQSALLSATPVWLVAAVAGLAGLAAPLDFVLGKFVRFAPAARRISQLSAPAAGAFAAASVTQSDVPPALVAVVGAVVAWSTASMLTSVAARASRSAAWVGLGHIPVLMAAATSAACIVPLGLAKPVIGYVLSAIAVSILGAYTLSSARGTLKSTARRLDTTRTVEVR
jgi:hypothetical protein